MALEPIMRGEGEMGGVVEAIGKGIGINDPTDECKLGFACWKEEFRDSEGMALIPNGSYGGAIDGNGIDRG